MATETVLLKTKLNMPVLRESMVQRQRLVKQLNEDLWRQVGFARRLTLFSAPAGYGKTTAALEWLGDSPAQVLWLSLEEGDNDPARFITYLVAAFQRVEAGIGTFSEQMVQIPEPPKAENIITPLINDLEEIDKPLILVLDDYHLIQNSRIHGMLSFFLDHQPNHLHQVILTREDPLLPVSRLLARGQAVEVRQEDLRFTTEESAEFLGKRMGIDLSKIDLAALQRRTEGWAAGLQFAALSLQSHPDLKNFVKLFTGSNRYILDYLFEEVFNRQPESVQEFLVRTSILNQLTAELCDALVEREDSQEVLVTLEKGNLFIVPLDLSREWYRYHRLFKDLLRHRLQLQEPVLEESLHLRASQWYEEQGMQAEAVQHALSAKAWSRAGELILGISNRMIKQGAIVTLLGWFKQFPEPVLRQDPPLGVEYLWVLILTSQNELAESWMEHLKLITQGSSRFQGSLASAGAFMARTKGDIQGTIELSEQALTLIPADDRETRGILAINLGIAYWHVGQMERAEDVLKEAKTLAHETGNLYALQTALVFSGRVKAVYGKLHQAERLFRQAIEQGEKAPIIGLAYLDLAALHYEWNDLNTSRMYLQQGQAINNANGELEFLAAGYMLQAQIEKALENQDGYASALSRVQGVVRNAEISMPNLNRCRAFLVKMALSDGDLKAARQLADQLKLDVDPHAFYRFIGLVKEELLVAQDKMAEAAERLSRKTAAADQAGWGYAAIATRVLEAIALQGQETSFEVFAAALERSQAEGYLRTYADHGQVVVPNLLEAARRGLHPEYVARILACIRQDEALEAAAAEQVEKLSEREYEVLRLIAVGLTNRQIAEQLYLSPGTVKTHVHNICGKLGVSNRTQAVMHARDLKLI